MRRSLFLCICFIAIGVYCEDEKETEKPQDINTQPVNNGTNDGPDDGTDGRQKKLFSFLQVMKFPNEVCVGTASRNGTCYSSDECTSKGGTASGNCANGFGVCCVFLLQCGQTTSENNTYLVLASTSTPTPSVCTYTICETNPNVCRIRLDFTSFIINGPQTGTITVAGAAAIAAPFEGGSLGDCTSDKFTLTSPNNKGSPVICGTNTGHHMIIDTTTGNCAKATFDFGSAAFARSYDIRVTQYNCNDEMAGPNDCLQYFTGNTGTITSYNFALTGGSVPLSATHLSNQNYNFCFRRNVGKCAICFIPSLNVGPTAIVQSSFGLSIAGAGTAGKSAVDSECISDYLIIPNGQDPATVKASPTTAINPHNRFCGRYLSPATSGLLSASVCTGQRPFKVTFVTDANEVSAIVPAAGDVALNEQSVAPGGILGFSLDFVQLSC